MAEKEEPKEKKEKSKKQPIVWIYASTAVTLFVVAYLMQTLAAITNVKVADVLIFLYTLAAAASAGVLLELIKLSIKGMQNRKYKELIKFFNEAELGIKDEKPEILKDEDVPDGRTYTIAMPCGMAMSDFEKKKEAMEQYLKRKVTFSFNENLMITAEKPKKSHYPYDAPEPELFKDQN